MAEQQTTSLDALDASLQDLLKAAETITGEPLRKGDGVQIDNSGTHGSDGKQGGGQGSMSDAGKLDDIMIGKLTQAGYNASQINQILGFAKDVGGGSFFQHERPSPTMSGKRGGKPPMPPFKGKADEDLDDDDDDDEIEDEGEQQMPPGMRGKRTRKSFAQQYADDPDISDTVDVSAFLESFVARTTDSLDSIDRQFRKAMKKSHGQTESQFVAMAKAFVGLTDFVKAQHGIINELGVRLGVVEKQPAAQPRGVTSLHQHQTRTIEKSMPHEAGNGSNSLKKSEYAAILTFMNLEKGIKQIAGRSIAMELVPMVESNELPQDVQLEIHNFLRRNPGEAQLAKSYA